MSWCPVCKTEYQEGFKICSDCNVVLVDQLETYDKEEHWVFLMNVLDETEMNVIKSILEPNNIPILAKHKGAGGYLSIYMGMTNFGIDLFVSENQLEKAKEITQSKSEEVFQQQTESSIDMLYEEDYSKCRKRRIWTLLCIFYLPGLTVLIVMLFNAIFRFFLEFFNSLRLVFMFEKSRR